MAPAFVLGGPSLSMMLSYVVRPELMPCICAVSKDFALAASNPTAWESSFVDTRGLRPVGQLARCHFEFWSRSWVVVFAEWMTRAACFLRHSDFAAWWWRPPRPRLHVFPSRIVLRITPSSLLWNGYGDFSMIIGTPLRRGPGFKIGIPHGGWPYPEELAICLSGTEDLCRIAGCYNGGEPALPEEDSPPVLLAALFAKGVFAGFALNGVRVDGCSSTSDAAVARLGPDTVLALSCCSGNVALVVDHTCVQCQVPEAAAAALRAVSFPVVLVHRRSSCDLIRVPVPFF